MDKRKRSKILPIIIGALTILFIIGLFCYKAEVDNLKRATDFFTIVSALTTAATLIFMYKQLQSIATERSAQVLPEIYPEDSDVKSEDKEGYFAPSTKHRNPEGVHKFHPNFLGEINLHNVGLGLAINVTVTWEYDIEKVEAVVENSYLLLDNDAGVVIPFIRSQANQKIDLPSNYLTCCGKQVIERKYTEEPPLTLVITYENIYRTHVYQNRFSVKIVFNGYDQFRLKFEKSDST